MYSINESYGCKELGDFSKVLRVELLIIKKKHLSVMYVKVGTSVRVYVGA